MVSGFEPGGEAARFDWKACRAAGEASNKNELYPARTNPQGLLIPPGAPEISKRLAVLASPFFVSPVRFLSGREFDKKTMGLYYNNRGSEGLVAYGMTPAKEQAKKICYSGFIKEDSMSDEKEVTIGEYKGSPTISLPTGNTKFPFTFGLTKAKLILTYIEEIRKFVEEYDKPKG